MPILRFNKSIYRSLYLASEFLRRHRIVIVLGAFVLWTTMLAANGYIQEFGEGNMWFLIFGFFWLTVPMSIATYFVPRLLLKFVPLMNGYRHDKHEE